jgi:hypothetical protein
MIWVNTYGVIASMKHTYATGNLTIYKNPRDTMCPLRLSIHTTAAIPPVSNLATEPRAAPVTIWWTNPHPEPIPEQEVTKLATTRSFGMIPNRHGNSP